MSSGARSCSTSATPPGMEAVADNMGGGEIAPPPGMEDVKPIIAPGMESTIGRHWIEITIEGNEYSFNFKNMKVLVTRSEGDNTGNAKRPRTRKIEAKANDLCDTLQRLIKCIDPPTA
ncbi:unnamed protein product [Urochloa humidicola]